MFVWRLGRLDRELRQGAPVRHLLSAARSAAARQTLHPEEVMPVRLERLGVQEKTLRAVTSFILLYIGLFFVGTGIIAVDTAIQGPSLAPFDAISAAATRLGEPWSANGSCRPVRLVRELPGRLQAHPGRPDVGGPARGDPGRRADYARLLARTVRSADERAPQLASAPGLRIATT